MRKNLAVLFLVLAFVAAGATVASTAKAALLPLQYNGYNLFYDPNLNITWYDPAPTGMTLGGALGWAAALTAGGTTAGSWTLPSTLPVNGSTYNYTFSYNGSTDNGYNISAPGSAYPGSTANEMAYLYYVELGDKGYYNVNGNFQSDSGLQGAMLMSLQGMDYWSGTSYPPEPGALAWTFDFGDGGLGLQSPSNHYYALAVHSGDVLGDGVVLPDGPTVPIPATLLLLGPSLVGLASIRRRFGK